jgi:hypothetical protein
VPKDPFLNKIRLTILKLFDQEEIDCTPRQGGIRLPNDPPVNPAAPFETAAVCSSDVREKWRQEIAEEGHHPFPHGSAEPVRQTFPSNGVKVIVHHK